MQLFLQFADPDPEGLDVDAGVDRAITAYLNKLCHQGFPAWRGEKLMAGILFYESRFSRLGVAALPRAWRALRGWKRLCPGYSRRPLPLMFWAGLACTLAKQGQVCMGIMTLMMVSSYMRPGEAVR